MDRVTSNRSHVNPNGFNSKVNGLGITSQGDGGGKMPPDDNILPFSPPRSELHKKAREYARRGMPIFPCVADRKHPATRHSFKEATTDLAQIDRWWAENPNFNIGLEPERMGWAVIDIDPRDGGDASAFLATFTVKTPSGGSHLYYLGSVPSKVKELGPGIDTRGVGGYCLLPPSYVIEEKKGYRGAYTAPFFPPDDYDLESLPTWISEKLTKVRPMASSTATGRRITWEGLRVRLSWIHPAFNCTRPACYPPASQVQAPLGYGPGDWLKIGLVLRDGAKLIPLMDDEPHDWLGLAEDWSDGTLWHERTGETLEGLNIPEQGVRARLGGKKRDGVTATVATLIRYAKDAGCPLPADDEPKDAAAGPNPAQGKKLAKIVTGKGGAFRRIDWLWQDWLPRGKLTILSGEKGVGKSSVVYHVLAAITRGGKWPDGTKAPVGDILIWSAEDDWSDTIGPRLAVAGADFDRVHHVEDVFVPEQGERKFDPAIDMGALLEAAQAIPNLAAVLIDPVVSAVAGDSHKNAETRRGLQPIVDFAGARRAAVIGITHFNKNSRGKSPDDRINGSLAFGAIARMLWHAVKDDEDKTAPRRLIRGTTNVTEGGDGFDYTIHRAHVPGEEPDFLASEIRWGQFHQGTAGALIGEVQGEGGKESTSRLKEAEAFLHMMLPEGQGMLVADIKKAAEAHGVAWQTVLRAKRDLGIIPKVRPGAFPAVYEWRLSPRATRDGGIEY